MGEETKKLEERGTWGQWSEFLFTALGAMVGYGNVWRFPYVCYRNGGGAFLLPFFIAIVVLAIPIQFLEVLYCQYSNYGPGRVWEVCPLFKGTGLCMMMMLLILAIYYTMIMGWTAYYLVFSFSSVLPWSTCDNEWNTDNCTIAVNETVKKVLDSNISESIAGAATGSNITRVSPAEEYWFHKVLEATSGIHDLGMWRWDLVLCLLAGWIATLLCLSKGIHSLGKVAYLAAPLPYFILTCLLIRGCMLPGSSDGLYFFLVPRWELLGSLTVWRDAATQMFYSASLGTGITSTLASYNKFHNNCYRDAMIVPVLDTLTSVFVGLVIFAYLGYMANLTGKPMDEVVAQGPGLVMVAYPTALATLPLPQLWSVMFFFMLFVMGLDSQCGHVETLVTAVVDSVPKLLPRKLLVTIVICTSGFLLGLPLATQGGVYVLNLMDWYIASVALLLSTAIELLVLSWIYGTDRLYSDVEHMIGYRPSRVFKYAWKFFTPAVVLFLWIGGFILFEPISTKLPGFNLASDIGGIVLAGSPILAIPAVAVWELSQREGTLTTRIRLALRPTSRWRPAIYKGVDAHDRLESGLTSV